MASQITRELLENLYVGKKFSTWQIEKITGRSRSFIYGKLKSFSIETRDISESHVNYPKKHFNGNLADKAYLIGFAVGDLRVRKCGGDKSRTISIACASTKDAQIELFKSLFSGFGRVWESAPKGEKEVVSVEAFVDPSFDFLLPKNIRKNDWIFTNQRYFLSFLAGFTDADGSIFISGKRVAVLAWGNYKKDLLDKIKFHLSKLDIRVGSVICDNLKNHKGRDGYRRKEDYYHLNCQAEVSLRKILNWLRPLLKHQDRIDCLRRALFVLDNKNYEQ